MTSSEETRVTLFLYYQYTKMDMQSSSSSTLPNPGDLVWAKMKGFPPWPAKVLEKDKDTPLSRIPVLFFGTGEKAFMKASDVCDYYENKAQYEVPRKHKLLLNL
ncbi:PWWP domain protein [Cooperia oncophora]